MAELPANIVLADQPSELFDGFSIGSNDLTQLTLGVDRNSEKLAPLFDETDESVMRSITPRRLTATAVRLESCGGGTLDDSGVHRVPARDRYRFDFGRRTSR
nr:putative PEP-binding protein [Natrinema gelatinilyticum]